MRNFYTYKKQKTAKRFYIQKSRHSWMSGLWWLRKRDCSIGTLIIKASVFVQKREFLKIKLIVCICSARVGDPNTSLECVR